MAVLPVLLMVRISLLTMVWSLNLLRYRQQPKATNIKAIVLATTITAIAQTGKESIIKIENQVKNKISIKRYNYRSVHFS